MQEAAETRLLCAGAQLIRWNVYTTYAAFFDDSVLVISNVFDPPQFLELVQNNIIAAKEAVHEDHVQPEYHFSMLLSFARSLPDDWKSETRRVAKNHSEPPMEELLQAISIDIETSNSVSSRLWSFQALLRYAIVIYAMKTGHRSTGP